MTEMEFQHPRRSPQSRRRRRGRGGKPRHDVSATAARIAPSVQEGASGLDDHSDDPVAAVERLIAFDSLDYAATPREAWLYGIVLGWDAAALTELATRFGWTQGTCNRLQRLHKHWVLLRGDQASPSPSACPRPRRQDMSSVETAELVLAKLRSIAMDGIADIGIRDLQLALGIGRTSASNALRRLENDGRIERIRIGTGDGYPTSYRVAK